MTPKHSTVSPSFQSVSQMNQDQEFAICRRYDPSRVIERRTNSAFAENRKHK